MSVFWECGVNELIIKSIKAAKLTSGYDEKRENINPKQ